MSLMTAWNFSSWLVQQPPWRWWKHITQRSGFADLPPWLTEDLVFRVEMEAARVAQRETAFRIRLARYHHRRLRHFARRRWLREKKLTAQQKLLLLLPSLLMLAGGVLLANALLPIASYMLFTSPNLQVQALVSPLPEIPVLRQSVSAPIAQANNEEIRPRIIQGDLDYTNLSSWFPEGSSQLAGLNNTEAQKEVKEFWVDIPALNIEKAHVQIGGTNLDNTLVQYPGTAEPGELGAPVIFGHSVLRQFYNPSLKNPRRYMSIFSKIMTLKPGDQIFITYDNIRYTYSVLKKIEVKPEDTYILEQEYSSRQLKLVTCVPEGTYLRRGVVLAQLETVE